MTELAELTPGMARNGEAAIARIKALMTGASFEATRPTPVDIAALAHTLPRGSQIYLTALPGRAVDAVVADAVALRAAGLEPVPHLAARHHADIDAIARFLSALVADAKVERLMLIGGDAAPQPGRVKDALSVIESGVLEAHGLRTVGLPGFPDGHPLLDADDLEASLVTKTAALQRAGIEPYIVTQFCFDSRPILAWLDWLMKRGLHVPVRIGLAGPTSLMTWLNYARRCGVKASAEALASRSGLARHAFRSVSPDPMIRAIADATASGALGEVGAHFYAFGGVAATARWALAPMSGKIALKADGGFEAT